MNENMFVDHYRVLGIIPNATLAEIKSAYKRLVKRYHPDIYEGNLSQEDLHIRITSINEAYEILGNPKKRKVYDEIYKLEKAKEEEIRRQREEERRKREEEERNKMEEERKQREEERRQRTAQQNRRRMHQSQHNETFFENVKNSYEEIRYEERKNSLSRRHKNLSKCLDENFYEAQTAPGEVIVKIGKGTLHVGFELLYQLYKFSYITKDNVVKYVIRNRKSIAAVALAGVIFSSVGNAKTAEVDKDALYTPNVQTTQTIETTPTPTSSIIESKNNREILLTEVHRVKAGDTLSGLSSDSNTKIDAIKRINGLTSDTIYISQELNVPYYIKEADLEYYTQKAEVGEKSIYELAREYDTDVETIIRLNPEALEKIGPNQYIILSDSIVVPKFISRDEYNAIKTADKEYH